MTTAVSETQPAESPTANTNFRALLGFSIGPVQSFIEAARTTRDLWTGSYLLSWLSAHALSCAVKQEAQLIFPTVEENLLFQAAQNRKPRGNEQTLLPCLPNLLLCEVPEQQAETIAEHIRQAVQDEWEKIGDAVHQRLCSEWDRIAPGWDHRWQEQVQDFWDFRVTVLPSSMTDLATLQQLTGWREESDVSRLRRELLGRLQAAEKTIRQYPAHEWEQAGPGDVRPKCSLLGTLAQMGPLPVGQTSPMEESTRFWQSVTGPQKDIPGTRLGDRDRLCAISLIKRFAWSTYLHEELGLEPRAASFDDVYTVAASDWLSRTATADNRWPHLQQASTHQNRRKLHEWSGTWLHWRTQDQGVTDGKEEHTELPDIQLFKEIQTARRKEHLGPAPVYYAVLMVDGDEMGNRLRQADQQALTQTSRELARCVQEIVPEIVEQNHGTLIYAGGDDVLALFSTSRALKAAQELQRAFHQLQVFGYEENPLTLSGGLVVAHVQDNLREVMGAARIAERQAKQAGRNCLALSIRRRSGEHSTTIVPWNIVPEVREWVEHFQAGISDRWAYQLVRELPMLGSLPLEAVHCLIQRQISRTDQPTRDIWGLEGSPEGSAPKEARIVQQFKQYVRERRSQKRSGVQEEEAAISVLLTDFLTLVQSASFLARGRGED